MGSQGHASKQFISTRHVQRGKLICKESLMDEDRNANAKGRSTRNMRTHLCT